MKLLILLLISITAQASYIPESLVGQDTTGRKSYSKKARCEKKESEPCIKFTENFDYNEVIAEQTSEENNTVCLVDCIDEMAEISCSDGYSPKRGIMTVYCEKIVPRHVGVNATLKASHLAAKAQKDATDAVIDGQIKDMDLGKRLIAMVNASSKAKGLSKTQKKSLRTSLKDIKDDLEAGHICDAKIDIDLLSADGTLILQSDLDNVLAYIAANKTCL